MDKSGANKAAIDEINADKELPMVVRQVEYLNNIKIYAKFRLALANATQPIKSGGSKLFFRSAPCFDPGQYRRAIF